MSDRALLRLAETAGLATQWIDYRSERHEVEPGIVRALLEALELPCRTQQQQQDSLALLEAEKSALDPADGEPQRCFGLEDVVGKRRIWGLGAQLYSLRRPGDGGIGDFTSLARLARSAAAHGADAIAVSPLHALFAADVSRFSPYSPSSRLFLNALHADPAEVFGDETVRAAIAEAGLTDERAALEALPLIDWPRAAQAKQKLTRKLFARLPASQHLQEFDAYCRAAGPGLSDHARFESLHTHFGGRNWRLWPDAFQDSGSREVERFAEEQAEEVRFHCFLQWLADRGLRRAQTAAREAGMAIGLIGDLAVGTDAGGSYAWSRKQDMLIGVRIGAPPDELNGLGQDWGLSAFSPRALRRHAYAPFLEMLRAQLRHVGGLRIDHVLGLGRLWLIPDGAEPTQGAYLHYPLADLLRLIAVESHRYRAVIVGEDMGTVSEGFREHLRCANVLGIRVLWFERDHGLFVEPARWPRGAAAMTTTHDLPTVAGWWHGRDIDWRAQLHLYGPDADETRDRAERAKDRSRLWSAFLHADVTTGSEPGSSEPAAVVDAAAVFVARTDSPLMLLPLEDALGAVESPNIPGTTDEHPNWRRRLPDEPEALLRAPEVAARLAAVERERRRD